MLTRRINDTSTQSDIVTIAASRDLSGRTTAKVVRLDRVQWESAVQRFGDYSYRQNWAYGVSLAQKRGASCEHVAVLRDNELLGLADVRIKKIPGLGGGLAYISGGPLLRLGDAVGNDPARVDLCIEALVREFVDRRGLTLRILSPIDLAERNQLITQRFERAGFNIADNGEHYRSVLLDVERSPEQIRSSFHRHWRRQLSIAERKDNLAVSFGVEIDRFEHVARMSEALRTRKRFHLDLDAKFFADVQKQLAGQDRLVVGLVTQDGVPVAGNITAFYGDTGVYLVGASTEAALDSRASYLMHWRTIELTRERGCRRYDWGGIDPVVNPGVSLFKLRSNGVDVRAAGPFEKSPNGLRGQITGWAERAYFRIKGLKTLGSSHMVHSDP